jgi:hypothetical protein
LILSGNQQFVPTFGKSHKNLLELASQYTDVLVYNTSGAGKTKLALSYTTKDIS